MEFPASFPDSAAQIAIAIGIGLLLMDMAIFGFATLFLSFLGLGFLALGAGIYVGVVESYTGALAFLSVSTGVISALLWKPLQGLNSKRSGTVAKSDFHGLTFALNAPVGNGDMATHKHSGITWMVDSETPIAQGARVEVVLVEVGKFWVTPKAA